jgi:hypothetical protein
MVGVQAGVEVGWAVGAGEALPLPKSLPKENRSTRRMMEMKTARRNHFMIDLPFSKDVYIILILTLPVT